jgi:hypothetical protein
MGETDVSALTRVSPKVQQGAQAYPNAVDAAFVALCGYPQRMTKRQGVPLQFPDAVQQPSPFRALTSSVFGIVESADYGRAAGQRLAFTHVTVIDVTGGPAQPDMTIVVSGNRITAVGKTGRNVVYESN